MEFNSAFKGLKLLKKPGNGRLNNLNDPSRPQCVKLKALYCSLAVCRTSRLPLTASLD